jgi:hypothetical protein
LYSLTGHMAPSWSNFLMHLSYINAQTYKTFLGGKLYSEAFTRKTEEVNTLIGRPLPVKQVFLREFLRL